MRLSNSPIVSLVERHSRYVMLVKVVTAQDARLRNTNGARLKHVLPRLKREGVSGHKPGLNECPLAGAPDAVPNDRQGREADTPLVTP
jgi:hypothetical protein